MVIQCSRCLAKFRFDDGLMRAEGVWLRCGICQHEFFQNHPAAGSGIGSDRVGFTDVEDMQLDRTEEMPDLKPARRSTEVPEAGSHPMETDVQPKRRSASIRRIFVGVLVMLMVLAGVGVVAFPEIGHQLYTELSAYMPWIKKEPPPPIHADIQISEVKQRFIANIFAGNLRVVEGIVQNKSGRPLTRLIVKAMLVDRKDRGLGEKQAFAGNVLSDNELMTLTEEEMNHRLANPQGGLASNDRIMPGGRISFMIVLAREKPGVEKTFVSITGAERMLQ